MLLDANIIVPMDFVILSISLIGVLIATALTFTSSFCFSVVKRLKTNSNGETLKSE